MGPHLLAAASGNDVLTVTAAFGGAIIMGVATLIYQLGGMRSLLHEHERRLGELERKVDANHRETMRKITSDAP